MADLGTYDGVGAAEIATRLSLPMVRALVETTSTLDVAHRLGELGAPAGTLVLAERQTAGRGRGGRRWSSEAGRGIWMTLLERPRDAAAIDVLSLRVGIRAARVLERHARGEVRLKWPNDLYVGADKLAGVLIEARWRDGRPDWVAIGFGLNVRLPLDVEGAACLRPDTARLDVLAALVPALREAAAEHGPLGEPELDAFAARDLGRGRECVSPGHGRVRGITRAGELLVSTDSGEQAFRGGSLIFAGTEVGA